MELYEKLGSFYLGKKYDLEKKTITDELVLYDSKDLTTHAVCVGMTGSGKTGLCLSLLEEAAIDNIPAIIIDPRGDMTNLLLTFPDLAPENFLPWMNEDEARKKELSLDDYAVQQAKTWKDGLAQWGQSGDRIKMLKAAADFSIFTPGSTSGLAISILESFKAPAPEIRDDLDLFSERISTTISSLLGLIGFDTDPIKSRDHILLSNILNHFWQKGQDLDLSALILAIQNPPFSKIGILDLEMFYPGKERVNLAMALNNLLASPTFQAWLEGEPLDVKRLLYTDQAKPRISIFYIAHLSDNERMFFVSLLLNQILGWMRTQSGTSSLKAILYFDEIFGYMPPVENPPSKKPLLTLLKQARAFGLGVVLATQNPVDLDYKGLSNTGTWLIGRLQTEQDRERVLDGLATASGSQEFNRKNMQSILSNLGKRVFLLHNVHEDNPEIFYTRWALSYLAGPLSKNQIKELMKEKLTTLTATAAPGKSEVKVQRAAQQTQRPIVPHEIEELFLPIQNIKPENAELSYLPYLWGSADIHFVDRSLGIDQTEQYKYLIPLENSPIAVNWKAASPITMVENDLSKSPEANAAFSTLPAAAGQKKNYADWEKEFKDFLFQSQKIVLLKSDRLKAVSRPQETETDFRIRLSQAAREKRDQWVETLRQQYAKKISSLEDQIYRAQERIAREQSQVQQQKVQAAISIGTTLLGAFLGRKITSHTNVSRAGTAMRSASRTMKESGDVQRAQENLQRLQQELEDLQRRFEAEVNEQTDQFDIQKESLTTQIIKPQKNNISIRLFNFIWVPFWKSGTSVTPAF